MVTIDVPTCVLLGSAVALRNAAAPESEVPALRFKALALVVFGFAPLGQMFELYHRDWQWQYFVTTVPPWASMAFVVSMAAGGLLGFELTRRFLKSGNKRGAYAVAGVSAGFTSLYSIIFWQRVLWVGSAAEWQAGTAPFMLTHVPFMVLLTTCGAWLGFATWYTLKSTRTAVS